MFWFSVQPVPETYFYSEKELARCDKKCVFVFMQSTVYSRQILMKLEFSRQIFRFCWLCILVQGDTKKGNFWKTQQKFKKSKKKKLLTEIEPLQLAF